MATTQMEKCGGISGDPLCSRRAPANRSAYAAEPSLKHKQKVRTNLSSGAAHEPHHVSKPRSSVHTRFVSSSSHASASHAEARPHPDQNCHEFFVPGIAHDLMLSLLFLCATTRTGNAVAPAVSIGSVSIVSRSAFGSGATCRTQSNAGVCVSLNHVLPSRWCPTHPWPSRSKHPSSTITVGPAKAATASTQLLKGARSWRDSWSSVTLPFFFAQSFPSCHCPLRLTLIRYSSNRPSRAATQPNASSSATCEHTTLLECTERTRMSRPNLCQAKREV